MLGVINRCLGNLEVCLGKLISETKQVRTPFTPTPLWIIIILHVIVFLLNPADTQLFSWIIVSRYREPLFKLGIVQFA